jgi:hypothetical protein
MHKFYFDPIDEDEDKNELVWHNLELADKYHKTDIFIGASMGWFQQNIGKNYSDLEKALRIHKFSTHLYATEVDECRELELEGCDEIECVYEINFSCKTKNASLFDVLKRWDSYAENLENLERAGFLLKEGSDEIEYISELSDGERERMEDLKNLRVKIRVEKITDNEIIENIGKQIREKFNRDPDVMVVAQSDNKEAIYAFTFENRLLSDIGFIMRKKEDGGEPDYEVVKLDMTSQ